MPLLAIETTCDETAAAVVDRQRRVLSSVVASQDALHARWRGDRSERLLRVGFEYLYGSDPQYEFVFYNQNRAGIGVWYDF